MSKDSSAIDELIDSGKIEEVYKLVGCKYPKHDPTDIKYTIPTRPIPSKPNTLIRRPLSYPIPTSKCDGCCLLKFETKSYAAENIIPANPHSGLFSERNFSTVQLKGFKQEEPHCLAQDYISARQTFKKNLEKVFPSTV